MKANLDIPPLKERIFGSILSDAATGEGSRTYLTFLDKSYSFEETHIMSRAVARGLRNLGIARQDRVAFLLPNGVEFIFTWYACYLIGAVTIPINAAFRGYMLESVLLDAIPKGLVIHRSLLPALSTVSEDAVRKLEWAAIVGDAEGVEVPKGLKRCLDFQDLLTMVGPDPEEVTTYNEIQCITYTSGTTGSSKGVVIPNGQCFTSVWAVLRSTGLGRDDVLFTPFPLFHGLAGIHGVLPALIVGAKVVLGERFSGSNYWRQATESRATVAQTLPNITNFLKAQAPTSYDRAHRLRMMYFSPYDEEFERRFGVHLFEAYGLTETGIPITASYDTRRKHSCGLPLNDWEAEIVDHDDLLVPVGETGELVLRPRLPSIMMKGYLNKPEITLEAIRNLWFHTGDVMYRDTDGYFYFVDRKKERIRRRGENISSLDVERIILGHPELVECAALPYPAELGEDEVRVVLVLREGSNLTPEELMDWLKDRMPSFMMPRYVEFVKELPKNSTNKVQKTQMIEQGLTATAWDREAVRLSKETIK